MIPSHKDLCAFARDVHALAKAKGWYEAPRRWSQLVLLIQGEFHEANEDLRANRKPDEMWLASFPGFTLHIIDGAPVVWHGGTPSSLRYVPDEHGKIAGFIVEIADACIRSLDAMTYVGASPLIMQPPTSTDLAHLASIPADAFVEIALTLRATSTPRDLSDVVTQCLEWCEAHGLPLWEVMQSKHAYNATRPRKHGKVY